MKKIKVTKSIYRSLPKRSKLSHKATAGRVFICAGNKGFIGAGIMSSLAAVRAGAGYTVLVSDGKNFPWFKHPDLILREFKTINLKKNAHAFFLLGPGMGTDKRSQHFFQQFLKNFKNERALIDADALTILSKLRKTLLPKNWILTPHEGELARLLKIDADAIRLNRELAIIKAHEKFQCTILLKGHKTLIYDGDNMYEISNGQNALAKAGTGDVLAGIIAGLAAQGLSTSEAAILGATLHNDCAKLFVKNGGDEISLRPMDLIDLLPSAIKKCRK